MMIMSDSTFGPEIFSPNMISSTDSYTVTCRDSEIRSTDNVKGSYDMVTNDDFDDIIFSINDYE
jgi:hypothetical protein